MLDYAVRSIDAAARSEAEVEVDREAKAPVPGRRTRLDALWAPRSLLGVPGRSTRSEREAPPEDAAYVQRKITGAPVIAENAHAMRAASTGVSGSGGALPHLGTLQRLFGAHDLGRVRAFIGGDAAHASAALGAHAYATGESIAFARDPDLFTAAHEAAHVVQQRTHARGARGLGAADDTFERHADHVAAAVVRGESVETLLGAPTASAAEAAAVQRKVKLDAKRVLDATSPASDVNAFIVGRARNDPRRARLLRQAVTSDETFELGPLETLVDELATRRWTEAMTPRPPARTKGAITTEHGRERLEQWTVEPVVNKQKTGSAKHAELLARVLSDLQEIRAQLKNRDEALEYTLATWLPGVLMYLAHNSTHAPPQGMTQVQVDEQENPLFYFRSQSQNVHPHERFYFELIDRLRQLRAVELTKDRNIPIPSNKIPGKRDAILPSDPTMRALVAGQVSDTVPLAGAAKWKGHTTTRGELLPASAKGYSGDTAALVGARKTNAAVYTDGLHALFLVCEDTGKALDVLIEFLASYYATAPLDKSAQLASAVRAKTVEAELATLCLRIDRSIAADVAGPESPVLDASPPETGSLFGESLAYRAAFAETLASSVADASFAHFAVYATKDHPNLAVEVGAPPHSKAYATGKFYHTEGWVNVVLSFFGGLLNHFAAQAGLPVFTARRQSFGFLRPTLTDTVESFRLSLGAQPQEFASVVLRSLFHLDAAIGGLSPAVMNEALEVVERPNGKEGDRLTRLMRSKSTQDQAYADAMAHAVAGAAGFTTFMEALVEQDKAGGEIVDRDDKKKRIQLGAAGDVEALVVAAEEGSRHAIAQFEMHARGRRALASDVIGDTLKAVLRVASARIQHYTRQAQASSLVETQRHALAKLSNALHKGLFLLAADAPAGQRYSKAALVIEDILEHLVVLSAVGGVAGHAAYAPGQSDEAIRVALIKRGQLDGAAVHVYRMASGEQAGAATVLAAVAAYRARTGGAKLSKHKQAAHFAEHSPYFEFHNLLEKSMLERGRGARLGEVIDIAPYATKKPTDGELQPSVFGEAHRARTHLQTATKRSDRNVEFTLAVDITNCDLFDAKVLEAIETWKELVVDDPALRLVLFASLLKNEELGLDKFQAGRVIVIGDDLDLSALAAASSHPLTEDFLAMMAPLHVLPVRQPEPSVPSMPPHSMPPLSTQLPPPSALSTLFGPRVPRLEATESQRLAHPFSDALDDALLDLGAQLSFESAVPAGLDRWLAIRNASGQNNNCLIYALADALGEPVDIAALAALIRQTPDWITSEGYLTSAAIPTILAQLGAATSYVVVIGGVGTAPNQYHAELFNPTGGQPAAILICAQLIHFGFGTRKDNVSMSRVLGNPNEVSFQAASSSSAVRAHNDPEPRDHERRQDRDQDRKPRPRNQGGSSSSDLRKREREPSPKLGGAFTPPTGVSQREGTSPERKRVKLPSTQDAELFAFTAPSTETAMETAMETEASLSEQVLARLHEIDELTQLPTGGLAEPLIRELEGLAQLVPHLDNGLYLAELVEVLLQRLRG